MNAALKEPSHSLPPFAHLLKAWRSLRKQSQLELSLASGVSQRQVSFIESGRARPNRDTVLQLLEALEVPLRDRNAMLTAAGFAHFYRHSELNDPSMSAIRDALDLLLTQHEPNPALLIDRQTNLLGGNGAAYRVFGQYGDVNAMVRDSCGDAQPNLLRLTFHPAGLRPHIVNWAQAAPIMLNRARREAVASGDEPFIRLLEEITAYPGIPEAWRKPEMHAPRQPAFPLEFANGESRLRLFSMISSFGWPQDVITDEIRVESFFPADPESARQLKALAEAGQIHQ